MAKRQQLVSQYLENVPRAVLEEIQHIIREHVRGRNGVYALYRRGQLYYVGLARDLKSRLYNHLRDKHADSWDSFAIYLTIGDSHLGDLESLMLRVFRPKGNVQKATLHRAENLHPRFRRDLRDHFKVMVTRFLGEQRGRLSKRSAITRQLKAPTPTLRRYVRSAMPLRARHKGKTFTAQLRRDGRIRFKGKLFTSPSGAAVAAIGRPEDGWHFWQYERAPGDWVRLEVLRRK